jgi:predicted GH43/DUF377 family glycosyl hydrolase
MIKIKEDKVLVTPKDIKPTQGFKILGTFNPGAVRLPNGDILLYVRVMEKLVKTKDSQYMYAPRMIGESQFKIKIDKFKKSHIAYSCDLDFSFKDGTKRLTYYSYFKRVLLDKSGLYIKKIDEKPGFFGLNWDGELGVEDARITKIDNLYVMTYVSLSRKENVSSSYAISNDCINWYRRGIIFGEQNKDVVIFPEKIKNRYVAFERPEGNFEFTAPHIWMAQSKDLEYWGDEKSFLLSKKSEWDYSRTGAGPPPIRTKEGWLFLYHVVVDYDKISNNPLYKNLKVKKDDEGKKYVYSVGAALLDLKDPSKIIAKSKMPLLIPQKPYEKVPFENKNVIFPTGAVLDENQEDLLVYFGAGDNMVSVKKIEIKSIMESMERV